MIWWVNTNQNSHAPTFDDGIQPDIFLFFFHPLPFVTATFDSSCQSSVAATNDPVDNL